MKKIVVGAVCITLTLWGCSSLTTGKRQLVQIKTYCEHHAIISDCTLTNENGSWLAPSFTNVQINKAYGNLTVQCKSPLFDAQTQFARSSANGAAYANILLAGVGAIVDVNSGAGFDYPTEITFHASNSKDPKPAPPPPPPPPKPDYSKYKYKDFVHFPPLDLSR